MLAALNHPNIATIHGLEHSNSTHYLVMELVPVESLAERLRKVPLPLEAPRPANITLHTLKIHRTS